ncbi:MAG TPA: cytochrome c3 family protein, partial [Gemmatimonadaceae bacterium]
GMPSTATCIPCHKQVWLDGSWFAPVRQSLASGTPIQWNRVNQLPGFVYFDHAIHVNKGVGCEECHGRVDSMTTAVQVEPLTMGWCLDCHRSPAEHLRPVAQMTAMGWAPPAGQSRAALGRELVQRYHVRRLTDCTDCHR